ncbi:cyd operon protein YbgE [Actinobacillus equuli subsp. equuli]|uniref:cyd operon protein YbgE n=1 Tax=Actinobacillus TaxID=713 RepID=UPI0003645DFC|nr:MULTISPECIES: cyd operon protein YbgE [Actinobacillus]VEI46478.1 Cyd operon protein YbgE [Actinobacillus equuli]WGE43281.1 cyd operon protein YbgE [Actinobacillus equuli subsp. haemolyticus]WGE45570.1 cyd operon protein YbgE [Actinobacillus equuli subsp. haemolyticus]WGE49679.1 cyd operon protein YbgE [Actinobacillus equuli subsp. equuli]WGE49764.1 cyd operon protein YbgE [Actinobacillus equuli subsp. haemolyticus]
MIHSLYNLTRKGWLKALSFILAGVLFAMILLNANLFAQHFGGHIPYLAILAFYGMAILWIHGIGFEIQSAIWRLVFLPITGYLIVISSLSYLISLR